LHRLQFARPSGTAARVAKSLALLRQQKELAIEWITPGAIEDAVLLRAHTPEHIARLRHPPGFRW